VKDLCGPDWITGFDHAKCNCLWGGLDEWIRKNSVALV